MSARIGVDVGGTFTDLVLTDAVTDQVIVGKGPSTPTNPAVGVVDVLERVVPADQLRDAEAFLHGTTVGLNALLERKGAKVALITTQGFRDILELRAAEREAVYDLMWKTPDPLVPRHRRFVVTERVSASGDVVTSLDPESAVAAARQVVDADVEAVAVVLINSHVNPDHELACAEALREAGFRGGISLSHDVTGEYREYDRTSTTVIDAYIRPRVAAYLAELEGALRAKGFSGSCMITRSGGGVISFAEASERPFETIMSGPVAGAVGTGSLARQLGRRLAITADVGGTSFDTALVLDGQPNVKFLGRVVGMPLQTPWVDVRSIGAGGGSIAFADVGLLRVGPHSAGAQPGPVCYRRGGTQPTVTDAAAVLGMLGEGRLAAGLALDIEAAERAVVELAATLGLDTRACARGILTVANVAMANAIRPLAGERGEDPREALLVAFGGAGPLFGTLLARELGMADIAIPPDAGNFSAAGLLSQDIRRSASRTAIRPLDEAGLQGMAAVFSDLFAGLEARVGAAEGSGTDTAWEAALELRFRGQEYTLTIPVRWADHVIAEPVEHLATTFTETYARTYGHALDTPLEIVAARATLVTPLAGRPPAVTHRATNDETAPRSCRAHSFTRQETIDFDLVPRSAFAPGATAAGPLIIFEETTTTYVDAGFELSVHESGTLLLTGTGVAKLA